jgi:hypothetical protein
MNQPLDERISQLEHRVRRWRLLRLVLALLLVCALAVGGILTVIPATRERGGFWTWLPWVRAREAEMRAREAEERARLEAVRALQALDAAKEREKRIEAVQNQAP